MANEETNDLVEKPLLEFEAYERPHKVWTREFYSSVIVIAFLVSVILYFIEGLMPVVVIWTLVFMLWAMAKTEPRKIKTALTTFGLKSSNKTYRYEEMDSYWLETRLGSRLLRINLSMVPWHIVTVIDPDKEVEIRKIVGERVLYQEPAVTWLDKAMKWVNEKMPLE